jgi:ribosomal-protein-alanine N-acetyltransferase
MAPDNKEDKKAENKATASPQLQIRSFRPSDTPSISEILQAATEAAQWPPESYAKLASSPGGIFLVCETSTHAIGFLAARQIAGEAEILNIAVHPAFRRKGVASALLLAVFNSFLGPAVSRVFLELRESNLAARALYERHGFVPAATRKSYYRDPVEHALCMQKKLTAPPD